MRSLSMALVLLSTSVTVALGQDLIPDLKGTWTGKGKVVVWGTGNHHPGGPPNPTAPPRVREIETTHWVEGQDGWVAWGRSSSTIADTKEPFAWAMASDNRTIVGADMDGYFHITLVSADRMQKCYVHNGVSPTRSVVATCYMMERKR